MATQSFEQLIAGANKIKQNQLPESNTAGVVGEQLIQMVNKQKDEETERMKGITEYNVSVQHPTSGISGTNKYTLEGAIAKIPAAYRRVGIKCSFLDEKLGNNNYQYIGGNFENVNSWVSMPLGKTAIYNVTTNIPKDGFYDQATARNSVPNPIRAKGLVITYQTKADTWVTEQFIKDYTTGYEWVYNELNWKPFGAGGGGESTVCLLEYKTDVKTTRKQIPQKLRKEGLIITYKEKGRFITEQFILALGQDINDSTWQHDANWKQFADNSLVLDSYYATQGYSADYVKGSVVKYNITPNTYVDITISNKSADKSFKLWVGLVNNEGAVKAFVYDEWWDGESSPNYIRKLKAGESYTMQEFKLPDYCVGIKLGDDNNPTFAQGEIAVEVKKIDSSTSLDFAKKIKVSADKNTAKLAENTAKIKGLESKFDLIIHPDSLGDVKSVVKGGNFLGSNNIGIPPSNIKSVSELYLQSGKIDKIVCSGIEYSKKNAFDYGFFIQNTEVGSLIKNNTSKFTKIEAYIFCREGLFKDDSFRFYSGRGQVLGITTLPKEMKSEHVCKYSIILDNSVIQSGDYLYISAYVKDLSVHKNIEDFGFTGVKIAMFDSLKDAKLKTIKADWFVEQETITIDDIKNIVHENEYGPSGTTYNNLKRNKEYIDMFLGFMKNKVVNKQNRLLVSFNGDSIIGSQLDDVKKSEGYDTGVFPPNMSRMIIARKFYDKYKFQGEDTIFRNLIHTDWTKTNFGVDNGRSKHHFNRVEVFGASEINGSASITVQGYKYFKLVWSNYISANYRFDIQVSVDDAGMQSPSSLKIKGLPDSVSCKADNETLLQYAIAELDKNKKYIIKIIAKENPDKICLWGCEYWNNPRLDVVVEAFSGSIAKQNRTRLIDGYYSAYHKPMLIISDLLAINDSSYIKNAGYTIEEWANDNAFLIDYCKKNGVPMLFFLTHAYNGILLTNYARGYANYNNLFYIDIAQKMVKEPPVGSIVNSVDGLHLSDNGIDYYFKELAKIFG